MKLYSWNMLYRNRELDRALRFIATLEFDVLCLQEVPEKFLARLQKLPLHIAFGSELDFVNHDAKPAYCVILSNHPILERRDFALPQYAQPLRTIIFVACMHLFGWRFVTNRRSLFADVAMPGIGRVRVHSLHLTLSHPTQRVDEFNAAMRLCEQPRPSVVCGDLNILERPHITVLNWLLGGRVRDIFAWRTERREIEQRFTELKLQNPLRGKPTQTISRSQLDHILVPDGFRITRAEVLPDRIGSDHHPVFVECE